MASADPNRRLPALIVRQWLSPWSGVQFNAKQKRAQPPRHFYLLSVPAPELRSLCGIFPRQAKGVNPRSKDLGIQRQHDPERSDEIRRFVDHGYPWSTLSDAKRKTPDYHDLKKPGWLPTAIVVNILKGSDERNDVKVAPSDQVKIEDGSESASVVLPYSNWLPSWKPSKIAPFEVIDGQHRLWAFDSSDEAARNFDLPVVAFFGLDISWQAYLFWTINIKPKRINASLAFDLYPLLRSEDWLDRAEEHVVYRDTRAQELTEALWSYPDSPWYDRINMLGEKKNPWVRQAAWINTLTSTFVKAWDPRRSKTGGLFGSRVGQREEVLSWNRVQQAAFLIFAWRTLRDAVVKCRDNWAEELRKEAEVKVATAKADPAFYGPLSHINTDLGVRAYMQVLNDLCYVYATRLDLRSWEVNPSDRSTQGPTGDKSISSALQTLKKHKVATFLGDIGAGAASFDWRRSKSKSLSPEERRAKLVFRGGSGYGELRHQLLSHLSEHGGTARAAARRFLSEEAR